MCKDIILNMTCPFCARSHSVATTSESYNTWKQGGILIQDAMPFLSSTEREQLISQVCPRCQASIFGADDEYYFRMEEDLAPDEDDL